MAVNGYRAAAVDAVNILECLQGIVCDQGLGKTAAFVEDKVEELCEMLALADGLQGGEAGGRALDLAVARDRIAELSAKVIELEEETGHLIQAADILKEERDALEAQRDEAERNNGMCAASLADLRNELERARADCKLNADEALALSGENAELRDRVRELEERLGEANNRICAASLAKLSEKDAAPAETAPPAPDCADVAPALVPRVKVVEHKPKPKAEPEADLEDVPEPSSQFGDVKSGLVGDSPRSQEPKRFRVTRISDGLVDEGTASELANRHGFRASLVYKWASGKCKSRTWEAQRI